MSGAGAAELATGRKDGIKPSANVEVEAGCGETRDWASSGNEAALNRQAAPRLAIRFSDMDIPGGRNTNEGPTVSKRLFVFC